MFSRRYSLSREEDLDPSVFQSRDQRLDFVFISVQHFAEGICSNAAVALSIRVWHACTSNLDLVNTRETKPLCASLSNLADMLLTMIIREDESFSFRRSEVKVIIDILWKCCKHGSFRLGKSSRLFHQDVMPA